MKALGWERYKYVCGFYIFSLKEKKTQELKRIHFSESWQTHVLLLEQIPPGILGCLVTKSCLFFFFNSWFKNQRITEGLSCGITCAKPDFQSRVLDEILESGYSWDLWWEESLYFIDAEVRRSKMESMLTSPGGTGFHGQGSTRIQLFFGTNTFFIVFETKFLLDNKDIFLGTCCSPEVSHCLAVSRLIIKW